MVPLTAFASGGGHDHTSDGADAHLAAVQKGPNGGKLLSDGNFSVEMTLFEEGEYPVYRIYAYEGGDLLDPAAVDLSVTLERLGGRVDEFAMVAERTYLTSDQPVIEPHSFDVTVRAEHEGTSHEWAYDSYEGRTTIPDDMAARSSLEIDVAGPADVPEIRTLSGHIDFDPTAHARIGAPFPGVIRQVSVVLGDRVKEGDVLARIEGTQSLRTYTVRAPIDGIVVAHEGRLGQSVTREVLFEIADVSRIHAELFAFRRDLAELAIGQPVAIRSLDGDTIVHGDIARITATADPHSQASLVHVELDNSEGVWRPGQAISGAVEVARINVPLAVRSDAIQRFRDFQVVYAKFGETYEVRMLDLGRSNGEWTEVLGGLEPGTRYVSANSFLVKADVEKSGASHDH
jgi:cobalt-zinc-cadmium efflux system membrane fusion protein